MPHKHELLEQIFRGRKRHTCLRFHLINTMTKSDLGRTGCVSSYGSDIRLHYWGSQEFKAGTWRREGRQRRNTAYWLAFPDSQPDFLYILGLPTHSHQSRLYPTGLPIDQLCFFLVLKIFFFCFRRYILITVSPNLPSHLNLHPSYLIRKQAAI